MKGRIVICEDQSIVSLDIQVMLEKNGYTVLAVFSSAEEVLDYIKDNPTDLIISNFKLKGVMSGIHLAEQLKEVPGLKVIIISGEMLDSNSHGNSPDVAFHFIKKPFSSEALIAKIDSILSIT